MEDFYKRFYFPSQQDLGDRQGNAVELGHDEAPLARGRRILPVPARARGLEPRGRSTGFAMPFLHPVMALVGCTLLIVAAAYSVLVLVACWCGVARSRRVRPPRCHGSRCSSLCAVPSPVYTNICVVFASRIIPSIRSFSACATPLTRPVRSWHGSVRSSLPWHRVGRQSGPTRQ